MFLSAIIPAWREQERIAGSVRAARDIADEVIVVDATSPDETARAAARAGARVIEAKRGRGDQLHAGALAARGDVLLFLHADTIAPPESRQAIERALRAPEARGGNFYLRFVPESPAARLFTWANDARRRWLRIYYGDSAIFVRREVYLTLGGYRPLPIFEDYEFVRRLERSGPTVYVRDVRVETSARRFAGKPIRTLAIWSTLQLMYSVFEVDPSTLARLYADIR